jgi:hypothetical protein
MKHRTVGLLLIVAASFVALTIRAAEPDPAPAPTVDDSKPAPTVDDSKPAPQPALSVEREGEKFTALKIHAPDGKLLAIMWPDGRVDTFSAPDEAARAFWEAFSGYVKGCAALQAEVAKTAN